LARLWARLVLAYLPEDLCPRSLFDFFAPSGERLSSAFSRAEPIPSAAS
jgi:hypothetical protein